MSILDCFQVEACPESALVIYDSDRNKRIWYAEEVGGKVRIGTNKVGATKRLVVPMLNELIFPTARQEDVACDLLLQMARWFPMVHNLAEVHQDASHHFGMRDLMLFKVLTSKDHRFIQHGIALAVAAPEYTGRRVHQGGSVGLALLNRGAVRSYRYRVHWDQRSLYDSPYDGVEDHTWAMGPTDAHTPE